MKKRGIGTYLSTEIDKSMTLVEGTKIIWDQKKLRKLLKRKGIPRSQVFIEVTVHSIDDTMLDKLVKSRKLKIKDLEKVSDEINIAPYLRFTDVKDE